MVINCIPRHWLWPTCSMLFINASPCDIALLCILTFPFETQKGESILTILTCWWICCVIHNISPTVFPISFQFFGPSGHTYPYPLKAHTTRLVQHHCHHLQWYDIPCQRGLQYLFSQTFMNSSGVLYHLAGTSWCNIIPSFMELVDIKKVVQKGRCLSGNGESVHSSLLISSH